VAANVENRVRSADITFDCRFTEDLGTFEIDPGLVRTALLNILDNAVEACIEDPASKSFRITFHVAAEGEGLLFDISDNGGGMAAEQTRKIFDKFTSFKGHKGTGLGLFISQKIIRKHGGTITVDSELGHGTRVSVRLPRRLGGRLE
jgi:signal transduction histidine kinase